MHWFLGLTAKAKIVTVVASILGLSALGGAIAGPVEQPKQEPDQQSASQVEERLETKTVTETEEIPFETVTVDDTMIEKGQTVVKTEGVNGAKTKVFLVTYKNGEEVGRKLESETVSKEPVTKVVANGAKAPSTSVLGNSNSSNCDPNYSPCIPKYPPDLDCPDIGRTVTVIGSDPHRLDRDNDGLGCE